MLHKSQLTPEDRLPGVDRVWTRHPEVMRTAEIVLDQNVEPGLVQGFHDNTGHCSVVSIQVEGCPEEEQCPGQAKGEKKMTMMFMILMMMMMLMMMDGKKHGSSVLQKDGTLFLFCHDICMLLH